LYFLIKLKCYPVFVRVWRRRRRFVEEEARLHRTHATGVLWQLDFHCCWTGLTQMFTNCVCGCSKIIGEFVDFSGANILFWILLNISTGGIAVCRNASQNKKSLSFKSLMQGKQSSCPHFLKTFNKTYPVFRNTIHNIAIGVPSSGYSLR